MKHTYPYNTLFLDRDGVINVQLPGDYVKSITEFVFIEGVTEALQLLSRCFRHIVVVTNQRGIGRGLMSWEDVETVHRYMLETIRAKGGRIDQIYVSGALDDSAFDRKPNIGMALQAKQDFPGMDFSQSWMVGDSLLDMQFANNAGIRAVLIGDKYTPEETGSLSIDARYPDLLGFAREIEFLRERVKKQ